MTNLEIEERNLKSLAQKIQLKLVDVNYLVQNHGSQLSRLFQWLLHRADTVLKRMPSGAPGTTCSMQAIATFANIFLAVSKSMEGRALIQRSGGVQTLNDLLNCMPPSEQQAILVMQNILQNVVQDQEVPGFAGGGGYDTGAFNMESQMKAASEFIREDANFQNDAEMESRSEMSA